MRNTENLDENKATKKMVRLVEKWKAAGKAWADAEEEVDIAKERLKKARKAYADARGAYKELDTEKRLLAGLIESIRKPWVPSKHSRGMNKTMPGVMRSRLYGHAVGESYDKE